MHITLRDIYFTGDDMILYNITYLHPFMPMVVKSFMIKTAFENICEKHFEIHHKTLS